MKTILRLGWRGKWSQEVTELSDECVDRTHNGKVFSLWVWRLMAEVVSLFAALFHDPTQSLLRIRALPPWPTWSAFPPWQTRRKGQGPNGQWPNGQWPFGHWAHINVRLSEAEAAGEHGSKPCQDSGLWRPAASTKAEVNHSSYTFPPTSQEMSFPSAVSDSLQRKTLVNLQLFIYHKGSFFFLF